MKDVLIIELRATPALRAVEIPKEAGVDVLSALETLCSSLEESGCAEFMVSGFGQEKWPVDVRTDLLTVLEQLPSIVEALRLGANEFELDFFEQGVQRRVTFESGGDELSATCYSGTDWQPNPRTIHVHPSEIRKLISSLRDNFLHHAATRCPSSAGWPALDEWRTMTRFA